MDWMCTSSPKFICWNPNPQCNGICTWGLWEMIGVRLGLESGVPMMGTAMWKHNQEESPYQEPDHADNSNLRFPASKTVRNKCILFKLPNLFCCSSPTWLRKSNEVTQEPLLNLIFLPPSQWSWLFWIMHLFPSCFLGGVWGWGEVLGSNPIPPTW